MKKYLMRNKMLTLLVAICAIAMGAWHGFMAVIISRVFDIALQLDVDRFLTTLAWAVGYFVLGGICLYIYSRIEAVLVARIKMQLRQDVFNGVMSQSIGKFQKSNSADYLSALTNDVQTLETNFLLPFSALLYQIVLMVTSVGILFYYSYQVALGFKVFLALVIIVPGLFTAVLKRKQDALSKSLADFTVKSKDLFSGFEVIKSFQLTARISERFMKVNRQAYEKQVDLEVTNGIVASLSLVLGISTQIGVMFLAAFLVVQGQLAAASLIALVNASAGVVGPIQALSTELPKMMGCKPVIQRVSQMTKTKKAAALPVATLNETIEIKDLEFRYDEGGGKILKGISHSFQKNKKYALIGRSGCGKSTLANLITGHLEGYSGEILFDGKSADPVSISSSIHQNIYMFDETIGENITLHKKHSKSELAQAMDESGVSFFLNGTKSEGSNVGENGNQLSGGQRQRIAVARALIENKPLLILDEGTSALDNQTSFDIENRLLERENLTLFTITHDLNPELLKRYDEILYMEDGEIKETGAYEELVNKKGTFFNYLALR